jgi:hypothetical protein
MLGTMEIAVGVLLGLAGLVLAGLVAAVVAGRRTQPPADPVDDLPDFLEFPPGSAAPTRPGSATATHDVVALSPPPGPPVPRRRLTIWALAALAGLAVLLLVAAVVVASLPGSGRRGAGEHRPAVDTSAAGDEARLRFGGIVLEERAVGVTVTYPELTLEADSDGPVASLELPTWNCLAAEAPEDPADAGCGPGRTEYAELRSPDLEVTRDGQGLRIAGAFATTTRPAGGEPEPTDRTYDVVVTVSPEGSATSDRRVPASGDVQLEDRRTSVVEGDVRIAE